MIFYEHIIIYSLRFIIVITDCSTMNITENIAIDSVCANSVIR